MPAKEQVIYQRILFHSAMLVMACDGDIHTNEINEMRLAFERTQFFTDIGFDEEMERLVIELHKDKAGMIGTYLEELGKLDVDPVQKLQILEIILRIIYADNRVHENEVKFFRLVKDKLMVPNEIVFRRFGEINFLSGKIHADKQELPALAALVASVAIPDIEQAAELLDEQKPDQTQQ